MKTAAPDKNRFHARLRACRRKAKKIDLLQAPFTRLFGSCDPRLYCQTMFDASLLEQHGYDVRVINFDASQESQSILSWPLLAEASSQVLASTATLRREFDRFVPEIVRRLDDDRPDACIVVANDGFAPDKGLDDLHVVRWLGNLLSDLGIPSAVVGALPNRFSQQLLPHFSTVVVRLPGRALIKAIEVPQGLGLILGDGPHAYHRLQPVLGPTDSAVDTSQVSTEVGCPWGQCGFCPVAQMYGSGTTPRSDDDVCRDIEARPAEHIRVVDACFAANLERLRRWAPRLEHTDKTFEVSTRLDLARQPERLDLLRRCGVVTTKHGVESFSETTQFMNKAQTADQALRDLEAFHAHGFNVVGYVLLGTPGETPKTLRRTVETMQRLDWVSWLPNIYCELDDTSVQAHHFSLPQAHHRLPFLSAEELREIFTIADRHRFLYRATDAQVAMPKTSAVT